MHLVLPADILLRYLIDTDDVMVVTEIFASSIYNKEKVSEFLTSFLHGPERLGEFLMYITDYNHYKKNYFTALKKYVVRTVKNQPSE
mgnify:CR=1 FL=1